MLSMANNTILFIFEGSRTEPQIFENMKKHYFTNNTGTIIHATFDTHIYTLWDTVKNDEYLDLLEVLKERNHKNSSVLKDLDRENVDRIFLFFDYDGHVNEASDEEIEKMLEHFKSPDENGKLYISYPMVEALKHYHEDIDFKNITVPAKSKIACNKSNKKYKELVSEITAYQDLTRLTKNNWSIIIIENLKKALFIAHNKCENIEYNDINSLDQNTIFDHHKYIKVFNQVAVLSAFPFFIIEYFGEEEFNLLDK